MLKANNAVDTRLRLREDSMSQIWIAATPNTKGSIPIASGMDMMRIEELEREFQQQYRVSDDAMEVIRSDRT